MDDMVKGAPSLASTHKSKALALDKYKPTEIVREKTARLEAEIKLLSQNSSRRQQQVAAPQNARREPRLAPGEDSKLEPSSQNVKGIAVEDFTQPILNSSVPELPLPVSIDVSEKTVYTDASAGALQCEKAQAMTLQQVVAEMQRRQASYMRREDILKQQVQALREQLAKTQADHNDEFLDTQKQSLQTQMKEGIQELLETAKDQHSVLERVELLKLKDKLNSVENAVTEERIALSSQQQTHSEKLLKLQQELRNTQDVALKLDAENREAVWAMQRMRADFKSQEGAKELLAADNVMLRKDNDILKETVLSLSSQLESLRATHSGHARPFQQLEELQVKYDQLLQKHGRTTDQLQRAARMERQHAKSAKRTALMQSAQQGELHNILRSLLERVRAKLADAGGGRRQTWIHGEPVNRPRTATRSSLTGGSGSAGRTVSVADRPFSAHTVVRNASTEVELRCGRNMRPISSPNWGNRSWGVHSTQVSTKGVKPGQEQYMGSTTRCVKGRRPKSAVSCSLVSSLHQHQSSRFGLELHEAQQDDLIHELTSQQRILELLQVALLKQDGKAMPDGGLELAEDDDVVEVLNEDGVWVQNPAG